MKIAENNFKVNLGGNYYIDVDCLIAYKDKPLFTLKRGEDGLLLISFNIYGEKGNKLATIKNNNIYINKKSTSEYLIKDEMDRVVLIDNKTKNILCDIRKKSTKNETLTHEPKIPYEMLERIFKSYNLNNELIKILLSKIKSKETDNELRECLNSFKINPREINSILSVIKSFKSKSTEELIETYNKFFDIPEEIKNIIRRNKPESTDIELEVYITTYLQDGVFLKLTPEGTNLGNISMKGEIHRKSGVGIKIDCSLTNEELIKKLGI